MRFPDTSAPETPQSTKPIRRLHTAITMAPEVLKRIDEECDAEKGKYEFTKSRSTVIENIVRAYYGMPLIEFGRKVITVEHTVAATIVSESVTNPNA